MDQAKTTEGMAIKIEAIVHQTSKDLVLIKSTDVGESKLSHKVSICVKQEPLDLEDCGSSEEVLPYPQAIHVKKELTETENNQGFTERFVAPSSIKQEFPVDCHAVSKENISYTPIKQEPLDPVENQESSEGLAIVPVHFERVKGEPLYLENEVDNDLDENNTSDTDSGEEYSQDSESCGSTRKRRECISSTKGASESDGSKFDYSEDIWKLVKVYTMTEEERREEHRKALDGRKHRDFVCEHCALGFVFQEPYDDHMAMHDSEFGKFKCDLCHTWHKTLRSRNQHRLRHYRRYQCQACGALYRDRDSTASHAMHEHAPKGSVFPCDQCHKQFKRPRYLKRHIEHFHICTPSIECPVCKRIFYEKAMFQCHMRVHNKEARERKLNEVSVMWKCEVCSKEYKCPASLKKHMSWHEKDVPHDLCGTVPKDKIAPKKHFHRIHNRLNIDKSKEVTCPYCSRIYVTRVMLKRHITRMHTDGIKRFECDHCQRKFMTKKELRLHIVWSHLPARFRGGHECSCGKIFRSPGLLAAHVEKRHKGLNPPRDHRCPDCGKGFMDKQVLNVHMKVHSQEMYPCHECGLGFKTKSYVNVHYKLKHLHMTRAEIKAEKKLNGRRIRENSNVRARGNIHLDSNKEENSVKKYPCKECGLKFKTKSGFHVHYKLTHADVKETKIKYKKALIDKLVMESNNYETIRNIDIVIKKDERVINLDINEQSEEKYPCKECGLKFKTKSGHNVHYKVKHPNVTATTMKDEKGLEDSRIVKNSNNIEACGNINKNSKKVKKDTQVISNDLKVHSQEKYPCKECGLRLKTKPDVELHFKLKHLNMTRGEVKAEERMNLKRLRENSQGKANKTVGISKKNIKVYTNKRISKSVSETKPMCGDPLFIESIGSDPLQIENVDIKSEPVEDLQIQPIQIIEMSK